MWFNPIIEWLLHSPLHGLLSKNTKLITYTGQKSGNKFTTPVYYLSFQDSGGEFLATTSQRDRVWWRNLRCRAPGSVRLQGNDLPATAEDLEEEQLVEQMLGDYFRSVPNMAKYFQVGSEWVNI